MALSPHRPHPAFQGCDSEKDSPPQIRSNGHMEPERRSRIMASARSVSKL